MISNFHKAIAFSRKHIGTLIIAVCLQWLLLLSVYVLGRDHGFERGMDVALTQIAPQAEEQYQETGHRDMNIAGIKIIYKGKLSGYRPQHL